MIRTAHELARPRYRHLEPAARKPLQGRGSCRHVPARKYRCDHHQRRRAALGVVSLRRSRKPEELAKIYESLTRTVRSLAQLPILSFDEASIHRARRLQAQKLNVRKMDLCIAAIALEHQASIVTRNVRDFGRVPGLSVEDWSK